MKERYKKAKIAAWVGIGGNTILGFIKLIFGITGSSAALVADGVHSFSDTISSLIVFRGLHVASRPKDQDHPYGHGKAESLAAGSVAGLLMVFAILIAHHAWGRLLNAERLLPPTKTTLAIAFFSFLVKEGMFRYKVKVAKRLSSSSLLADAWHHRSDAFSSLVVIVGIAGAIVGGPRWRILDPLAAVLVAVFIGGIGIKIFRKTSAELMDEAASGQLIKKVMTVAENTPGVLAVEKIYARKSGLNFIVDIHVEVNKGLSVQEGHAIATEVKNRICHKLPEVNSVLVHIEPYYPGDH